MTTYTITIGTGEDGYAGLSGYLDGGFGSVAPAGHELYGIVWKYNEDEQAGPLGWIVEILSPTLPIGTVVTWLGEDYALTDIGGMAGYSGPLLGGGPPPTSGTTEFAIAEGDPTGTWSSTEAPDTAQFVGLPPVTGTLAATEAADTGSFSGLDPITGTLAASEAPDKVQAIQGAVLPRQPGLVAVIQGSTFTVPLDWGAPNRIRAQAAGGLGANSVFLSGGAGGGGGAYSHLDNVALTPGGVYNIGVGAGGDAWFGGSGFADAIVRARKGGNASGTTPGAGGPAGDGIGDVCTSGGAGGAGGTDTLAPVAGGGGGAGGPNGDGLPGTTGTLTTVYGNGGNADAGYGGAGGTLLTGPMGGSGAQYAGGLLGSGGGSGGGRPDGASGGMFGGGGTGTVNAPPGPAGYALLVFEYTPTVAGIWSSTEAPDTAAFAQMPPITGTFAGTDAPDTAVFAGAAAQTGTWSSTEAPDIASFSAPVPVTGTLAATEAVDTAAFSDATSTVEIGILIRRQDGTFSSHRLSNGPGEHTTVMLATPIPDATISVVSGFDSETVPAVGEGDDGALVYWGPVTSETERMLVFGVTPGEDLSFSLTLVDEAPELVRTAAGTFDLPGSRSYDAPGSYWFIVPNYETELRVELWGGSSGSYGISNASTYPAPTAGGDSTCLGMTAGGSPIPANRSTGGPGGVATGGDVNLTGNPGQDPNGTASSGAGGSAPGGGGTGGGAVSFNAHGNQGAAPGGGASGAFRTISGTNYPTSGSGSGAYARKVFVRGAFTPGEVVALTVGAGGTGGAGSQQSGGAGQRGRVRFEWS